MDKNLKVSELDFDAIKENIISFIKSKPEFTDYNFTGSALNNIIDILAYNTHYNAFYANMLHNESFLDTAQKRSSVVSKAKELGYTPRSAKCSTAKVDITLVGGPFSSSNIFLSRGTEFLAANDSGSYTFIVADDYLVEIENNDYVFRNVVLKEGVELTNTFRYVESDVERQIFTIPNNNVDIDTLKVYVKENDLSIEQEEYFLGTDISNLTPENRTYFVQESYDEKFQIYFGDDVFGKKLKDGNIITIRYLATKNKDVADGCKTFSFSGTIGPTSTIQISTVSNSIGGSGKESTEDIRNNSRKLFLAQDRAVTTNDYAAILKNRFSFIKSVNVWGGDQQEPPEYGKVFVSINTNNNTIVSDDVIENVVKPFIRSKNVVTILPVVIQPDYYHLGVITDVKVNKTKTTTPISVIPTAVESAIKIYLGSTISDFSKDIFKSKLIASIDNIDTGIISNDTKTFITKKINPILGVENNIKFKFNNPIVMGSVSSTVFNVLVGSNQVFARIVDNPNEVIEKTDRFGVKRTFGSLNLINFLTGEKIKNIGSVEYTSNNVSFFPGEFDFSINVFSTINNVNTINIYFESSSDIITQRNQILLVNTDLEDVTTTQRPGITVKAQEYV